MTKMYNGAPSADALDIPDFLLVANRVPLSPELQARAEARRAEEAPKDDRWRAREEARKQELRERAREAAAATKDRKALELQIAKHRARHPDPVETRLVRLGMLRPRAEREAAAAAAAGIVTRRKTGE